MSQRRFFFPKQDHTVGALLCDYLNRDTRVRAAGYTVRDEALEVQVDGATPELCVSEAMQAIQRHLRSLRLQLL